MNVQKNGKPISFVKTVATIDEEKNIVTINTRKENLGWGYKGQERLLKPWWVIVSAAFIFKTPNGPCVTLVRRVGDTRHSGKWALLPAGTSDTVCELLHPEEALYREIEEEFNLIHNGNHKDSMKYSDLLTKRSVEIRNEKAPERTWKTCGELYIKDGRAYFIRAYHVKLPLDETIIFDGEKDPYGNPLDRLVAVVPLDKLNCNIKPEAIFRSKKRRETRMIYLSGFQTDTLEWMRENAIRLTELL